VTERESILAACAERVGDIHQLLVAADWMAEQGDEMWERCLRWMAEYQKWPNANADGNDFLWTCYGGLCGPRFVCGTNHALPRAVCKRMAFWEWQCWPTWVRAVEQLAFALKDGWVECVGDPLEVDPDSIKEMDARNAEVIRMLGEMGVTPP
jgi:hypothetical protein